MTEKQLLLDQLPKVISILEAERECLQKLDIEGMRQFALEKEAILNRISGMRSDDAKVKELAKTVKEENRRNGYLVWVTLRFLKESMAFIGSQASSNKYKSNGRKTDNINGGLMLEGKI